MKLLCIAVLLILTNGCSDQSNSVDPLITTDPAISAAKKLLLQSCPELGVYASDFVSATAAIQNERDHWKWVVRDHDWVEWVEFVFTVSDNPKRIPRDYYAQGHNLFYDVSTQQNPGVDVGKKTAGQFCGKGRFNGFIAHD